MTTRSRGHTQRPHRSVGAQKESKGMHMRAQKGEARPDVNCATCVFSKFVKGNTHYCGQENKNQAVAGDYQCRDWEPLIVEIGVGFPPQRFGAMHVCPHCSN